MKTVHPRPELQQEHGKPKLLICVHCPKYPNFELIYTRIGPSSRHWSRLDRTVLTACLLASKAKAYSTLTCGWGAWGSDTKA
eukprot:1453408-Amphidinium_carterae.1